MTTRTDRTTRSWGHSLFAVLLGITLTALSLSPARGADAPAARLRVYWVDVEGGAATLIVTPAGESVLIDTGVDGERDPGRTAATARRAGLERIDHLVVTHFDIDHHGGAAEVHKRIPIARVYDAGDEGSKPQAQFDKYAAFRKTVRYTVLKPGGAIPLKQAKGSPEIRLTCLAANSQFIEPTADHAPNPLPADAPEYKPDPSNNARSVVLLLTFGRFRLLDAADLTGRLEARLVCPRNLVGRVDVFQVNHHGLDLSNNPLLIRSIQPTVTVMNNGHLKGCGPNTRAALKATPGIRANYQVHKNLRPGADNAADELIANFEPAQTCKGNGIELDVSADSGQYTVRIPATGHERVFKTADR
ncbi:MAG: ComEC family competence protein [Planctomycetes bacterium ADurb.Bin126]|nr:MAG: ComEC family competence protein [Planctomycetes bacterium ADurb.Bin126]HOD81311.1 MBL fold metallo-hydrolase [Phycisphaerae bacterium]HQL74561.1 MBL fold metallo-hydrolase [Phycisphaerae bacterium]